MNLKKTKGIILRKLKRVLSKIYGIVGFLLFFLVWEFVSKYRIVSPTFLPPLESIAESLADILTHGDLYINLVDTLKNFAIGYGIALAIGVPVSYVIGVSKKMHSMFDPLISALFSSPLITLLPLFVIVFGIYSECKIAMIFVAAIFPLIISLSSGLRAVPTELVEMAKSFGANGIQTFFTIYVPASMPSFISGVRISFTRALLFALVVEMYVSAVGIGRLISWSSQFMRMNETFAYIFMIAFITVCITFTLKHFEAKLKGWGI